MSPRRFLKGMSCVNASDPFSKFPFLDPTKYAVAYLDWFGPHFGAVLSNGNATYDGIYYLSSAATAVVDQGIHDNANGVVTFLLNDVDNDSAFGTSVAPTMTMRSGKKFFLRTKFILEQNAGTDNNMEMFIGVGGLTGAPITAWTDIFNAGGTAIVLDDACGFILLDGGASIYHHCTEADVGTVTDTTIDIASDVWIDMAMYYDGTDIELFCGLNHIPARSLGTYTPTAVPVTAVGPLFGCKNGEGAVKTLAIDFLFAACER